MGYREENSVLGGTRTEYGECGSEYIGSENLFSEEVLGEQTDMGGLEEDDLMSMGQFGRRVNFFPNYISFYRDTDPEMMMR